jgi:hypothetical protein
MNQPVTSDHVVETLSAALTSERIPGEARLHGARLLDRLKTPVNVVVMGRPQVGKSRLIQMLLGRPLPRPVADLPAFEVMHGPRDRQLLLREESRIEDWTDGARTELPEDAAMMRLELPVPLLTRMTLTEVALEGPPEEMRAVADWAFDRADIVLWCTQGFDAIERALWAVAPDMLKDHSFLVLTKADHLLMKGQLQDRLADLSQIVAQEFHSLYPVATLQAISARAGTGQTGQDIWSASGGRALHDAVLRLVETGRRADADNALLFLSRYAAATGHAAAHPVSPVVAQGPATAEATAEDAADDLERAQVLAEALAYLQDRADRLLSDLDMAASDDCGHVLAHCLETATTLSDLLGEFAREDAALTGLQDDIQESADMMLLLQLEQSEDAATDAVTLLLQLKKDMSDRTVA